MSSGLKHSGENCWVAENGTPCEFNGPCKWCGSGYCCRKGHELFPYDSGNYQHLLGPRWHGWGCTGNEGIEKKIETTSTENDELRKRILEYEHIKEKVELRREERVKLEQKLDRLNEYLERLKDDLAEQRILNLKNSFPDDQEEVEAKDTHVDLNMEMFIVHNKENIAFPLIIDIISIGRIKSLCSCQTY